MSPVYPVSHTVLLANQIFSDQQHLTNKQFNSFFRGTRLSKEGIPDQSIESHSTNNGEQNFGMLVVLFKPSVPLQI